MTTTRISSVLLGPTAPVPEARPACPCAIPRPIRVTLLTPRAWTFPITSCRPRREVVGASATSGAMASRGSPSSTLVALAEILTLPRTTITTTTSSTSFGLTLLVDVVVVLERHAVPRLGQACLRTAKAGPALRTPAPCGEVPRSASRILPTAVSVIPIPTSGKVQGETSTSSALHQEERRLWILPTPARTRPFLGRHVRA